MVDPETIEPSVVIGIRFISSQSGDVQFLSAIQQLVERANDGVDYDITRTEMISILKHVAENL